MHIEFLVEERSAEVALRYLVPKIVGADHSFRIHPFNGKQDLLSKLAQRLRGYARWLPENSLIFVLVDRDRDDCHDLKELLEREALASRLATLTHPDPGGGYRVVNRLAIEELEAWFLGDIEALVAAYPRLAKHRSGLARFQRDPDSVRGGTWERLEKILRRAGYYRSGLRKIENARLVSEHMDPKRNASRSFQVFCEALKRAVQ